ncbi:MAG: GDSL-type esterase/lipase family protein [Ilumatobacteraceae bacterium]
MTTFDRRTFLALAALAAAGCSSARDTNDGAGSPATAPVGSLGSAPRAITSVTMVGDSITEGSLQVLTTTLTDAGVTDLRIEGKRSRRIDVGNGKGDAPKSGIITIYELLAEGVDPTAWVIELGTNDVGSYGGAEEYGALIDKVTDMLPSKPLVWVNTYREQFLDQTVVFNTVLEQRMDARGNAVVADWYSVASAPEQTVLRSDHLHPNDNGQLALSLLVLQALQQL